MDTDDLDFELPPELIAQEPMQRRDASRLLHFCRDDDSITHRTFWDLAVLLRGGDVMVFNDSRVLPARFTLKKSTGGRVEGLFISRTSPRRWQVMLKNAGSVSELSFADAPEISARVIEQTEGGVYTIELSADEPPEMLLQRVGRMPLPPYIRREKDHDQRDDLDRERYQTVYAGDPGSIAAPTAGLHFSDELLKRIDSIGVKRVAVTLEVGLGTFKPITASKLEDHPMHVERYRIPRATADAINAARAAGHRVIAVGTTSARVLESQPAGELHETAGETGIFIHPPYRWKHVNSLVTNFHLPRSTLIALVAAMIGLERQRRAYAEAIAQRYRFFSYGDAMFIE